MLTRRKNLIEEKKMKLHDNLTSEILQEKKTVN